MRTRFTDFLFSQKRNKKIGLLLGPTLFLVILLYPTPQGMENITKSKNLPPFSPQIALGTMIWMIIWWVTESIPLGLTGLLAPFIFVISGILSARQALSTFADPIIWIFISGFILAAAFHKWGLDKRIAYFFAMLYKGSNPQVAVLFIICLPAFLLTMAGSITVSAAILFPFVIAFLNTLNIPTSNYNSKNDSKHGKDNKDKDNKEQNQIPVSKQNDNNNGNYSEASFLALGQAATAGAMLFLISTAPNLIAKATVEEFVPGKTISFTDWFIIGSPQAIIGLLVSWAVIFLMMRPEFHSLPVSRHQFRSSLETIGKITREEKIILSILLSALILWVVPSILKSLINESQFGFYSGLIKMLITNIPESIPALLIILAIALIRPRRNAPLLTWDEMTRSVDWNVVILFGGGLVLGLGVESSGLASWIALELSSNFGTEFTSWSIFGISAILGFVMSYAASNTASAVIVCPLAATLAIGAGLNPIPPILAAALACSISSSIPSTTPPMAIIYSSKKVKISNMFKTGITSDLIRLVILLLLGPILIGLVFK
ncbi:MAG TPA: SLC13 family permease [Nitrososphaeraceae archaeon]|jgi:sodium-dependent dicarboxylate transporter 2/3/5